MRFAGARIRLGAWIAGVGQVGVEPTDDSHLPPTDEPGWRGTVSGWAALRAAQLGHEVCQGAPETDPDGTVRVSSRCSRCDRPVVVSVQGARRDGGGVDARVEHPPERCAASEDGLDPEVALYMHQLLRRAAQRDEARSLRGRLRYAAFRARRAAGRPWRRLLALVRRGLYRIDAYVARHEAASYRYENQAAARPGVRERRLAALAERHERLRAVYEDRGYRAAAQEVKRDPAP